MDLWRERAATPLSPFEKPWSVYTHRRNALISVGEGEELKSTRKVFFGMGHNMRVESIDSVRFRGKLLSGTVAL